MAKQSVHGLGELQTEVMELVWEMKEATVAQIAERISAVRPVTYTTVLAAMQKLTKKGWLVHRQEGKAYVYRATRSRNDARGTLLREVLGSAFEGDPTLLLSSLLDATTLSDVELKELRQLIEQRRKERNQ